MTGRILLVVLALFLAGCAQDDPTIDAPDGTALAFLGMRGAFAVA